MKVPVYLTALLLCLLFLPSVQAEEYGRIRAMRERAADVIKKKNDFIARVLTSYAIPHERNKEGAVVSLLKDSRYVDVTKIEVIPLLKEGADKNRQVVGHELLFYTPQGVLTLVSELVIR